MEESNIYKLVLHPNPSLKEKLTEEVETVTDEHREIASKMLRTMRQAKGAGLSTPQVGLKIRMIVYDAGQGARIMFNPVITKKLIAKEGAGEGCLSFPRLRVPVKRFKTITVKFLNSDNEIVESEFTGWEARIIQHEIDHLDGITFLQRR